MTLQEAIEKLKRDAVLGRFDEYELMDGCESLDTYIAITTILNAVVKGELKE